MNIKMDGESLCCVQDILDVLLLEMSQAVIRSGKSLSTRREMASECALEVDSVDVSSEVFVKSEALGVGAASNMALEGSVVCSGVLF
jgi:hypothetical protein